MCILVGASACTTGLVPATGEREYLGLTWEQERELGKQAVQQIAAAFGIYHDPELQEYVEEVGRRVLAQSHLRQPHTAERFLETPITFQILDSPTINAMAIPGGHIYVTRGLLAHLNSEDQLAFVLAHEIGHVSGRHAARRAWQQRLGQGLLMGGVVLGQVLGLPGGQLLNLGGAAAQLIFLRHSRGDELEADRLAVAYTSLAGYEPRRAMDFFRTLSRIEEQEGGGLPNFLSTHPNPGNRLERIAELAGQPDKAAPSVKTERSAYFAAIAGIVLGEDPRHGFVRGDVFYHPELRFRFPVPRGFRLINQPAQVIMIESQGRALIGFTATGEPSLRSASDKFLSQPGLRVVDTFTAPPGGPPAMGAVADAQTQDGQIVRLLVYFIEHNGEIYQFLAYSPVEVFRLFRDEFLRVARGFGDLNDPEILTAQPVRLRLEQASRTAPFRSFIPELLPHEIRPEEVAILNQVTLDEEIRAGRILKLPGRG